MRLNALAAAVALNVALVGALVWLWHDEQRSQWVEPAALAPSLDDVVTAEAAEAPEVSRYRETLERPLFAATRKIAPKRDPAAEAEAAVDPLKDVRLLGTYGSAGRGGILVLRDGKVERVPLGSSIGVWKVSGEGGRGATFVNAKGESRRLELALNSTAPGVPAPAGKPGDVKAPSEATPEAAPVRSAESAQRPASAPGPGPAAEATPSARSAEDRAAARRKRLEQINARRAQSGMPPLTE